MNRYEQAADVLLRESGCTVRAYRNANTGTAFTDSADWGIIVPRPRGPVSFGVFAHEVGHQMLHRGPSSKARWVEEVEAEHYALAQFDRFALPGQSRYEELAARHLAYAFRKAVRRGVRPWLIAASQPYWFRCAQEVERASKVEQLLVMT